jgi:hypothetical protein
MVTSCPLARKRMESCVPTKPSPPVIRTFMDTSSGYKCHHIIKSNS